MAPATPHTSNVFVDQVIQTSIDKIDLLFMIDNSISMADKQTVLREAVPALLGRLITPACVDENGNVVPPQGNGSCQPGTTQEFKPVNDIHIGVVSSSLGNHGGTTCTPGANPTLDDKAQLLPSVRTGLTSHKNLGFLAWKGADGGITDENQLITEFSAHVSAAGETGCGYEASLEAWYRFMIDPEPPLAIVVEGGLSKPTGINDVLLAQRTAFLRPDSLVAIIMLSDENDCSIKDSGQGHLIATQDFQMPAATGVCALNPNDACCRNCNAGDPAGCTPAGSDPACTMPPGGYDHLNLRCFDQMRRFGVNLLHPTSRYVRGMIDSEVPGQDGSLKPNPLYTNLNGVARDPSLVFLAGILGVPWQDIATEETRTTSDQLKYLSALELADLGRWDVIVGSPSEHSPPLDPFMVESSAPRSGTNPVTGDMIVGPGSMNPRENPINGHEYNAHPPVADPALPPAYDDLQYACIYQLPEPRTCAMGMQGCDCDPAYLDRNKPLCNPVNGGPATASQVFAKAYPGLRELEVLKNYALERPQEANSIVASICPKVLSGDKENPNYGYNPAVGAIIDRLKVFLAGRCLPRPLEPDEQGIVPCALVEAAKGHDCNTPGRIPVDELVGAAVRKQLEESKACSSDCGEYVLCEILPAGKQPDGSVNAAELEACQQGTQQPDDVGYCYIDEALGIGNPILLQECPATERRILRFIGNDIPKKGALTFIACIGESTNKEEGGDAGP